jgi:hypothetical protein
MVDAAQSFGMVLTGRLLSKADIFIAPLHKHVGLAVGLALVGVRHGMIGYEVIRAILHVAESGAAPVGPLEQANAALCRSEGRLYNRATIVFDDRLRRRCDELGLVPSGDPGDALPLGCFGTGRGVPLDTTVDPCRASACYFRAENSLRFSYSRMGRLADDPEDYSGALLDAIGVGMQRSLL